MSDFWHKMGCCMATKPPPKKKGRRIDRSMIGEPTNFIHLTHIGSGEMADGLQPSGSVQEQMRSKGPNMNVRSYCEQHTLHTLHNTTQYYTHYTTLHTRGVLRYSTIR
uniref:CDC42 small effector 1 n=2 Tax=Salarias fasciatus TaxID=181472 RepID=A0A672G4E3_SALFA